MVVITDTDGGCASAVFAFALKRPSSEMDNLMAVLSGSRCYSLRR